MKYSVNDLCVQDDLYQLFNSPLQNLVNKHEHQETKHILFSQKLRDLGIEPCSYPSQVALYKFRGPGTNHDVVVLIPTEDEDVNYLLTRIELSPNQDIDLTEVQVLSIDDIIPEERIVFCLRELSHPFETNNSQS